MNSHLVFSPFAKPFVPLGIAQIKSYVEKKSAFTVTCSDLNLLYYKLITEAVRKDHPDTGFFPKEHRRGFIKTMDLFENSEAAIFNQAEFDRAAIFFTNCFKAINQFFQKICQDAVQKNKGVPFFIPKFMNLLLDSETEVIGFSVVYPEQFYVSALIAKLLKQSKKDIKIVFGGDTSGKLYKDFLANPFIDFVIRSEGEKAFLDLLNSLENSQGPGEISNLAFKEKSRIKSNEPALIKNLNHIPFPDFSDFDLKGYFKPDPVIPILGSRGCYWRKCSFCVHYKSHLLQYRKAAVKRIVDELEYHVKNGIRYFDFVDEMIPASRFRQISDEILKRGLKINYYALAKPTDDFNEDVLNRMYRSGCRYIIWGVESGCQRILDLIDKGTKIQDVSTVLADAHAAGIKNHVFIIIGFPTETKEEFKKTLTFLYEHQDSIDAIHDGIFGLQKGSRIFKNPKKFSITKIWTSLSSIYSLQYCVSKGLTPNDATALKAFYAEKYFQYFSFFSTTLTSFRDHALLIYSNPEKLILNKNGIAVPDLKNIWPPPQKIFH